MNRPRNACFSGFTAAWPQRWSRRFTVLAAGLGLLIAGPLCAQTGQTLKPTNLRVDPSTRQPPRRLVDAGASFFVLSLAPENGFYQVRLADGSIGWLWNANVTVSSASLPAAARSLVTTNV